MNHAFSFQEYVEIRKHPNAKRTARGGFGEYIFSGDYRVLRSLAYMKPVKLSVDAAVRAFKAWKKSDLVGGAVKVSPRQFPRVYELTAECAGLLHIPVPTVYVKSSFQGSVSSTYGTEQDSFILVRSGFVDRFSDAELKFIIGRECGHIQNSHVAYGTALYFLTQASGAFVRYFSTPATVALKGWSRRGEVTADRAGLLTCKDLDVARTTMIKLAIGSTNLSEEINVEEYMEQLDDIKRGVGRLSELWQSFPYLPKRIKALELFAESEYYRRHVGLDGGKPLVEIDKEVDRIVSVW